MHEGDQRRTPRVSTRAELASKTKIWRPQLRDPNDEMVLEAAVNGHAHAIVTFNQRDFLPAASRFGFAR
jgi:predicted nucleic acid-binding protein